MSIKRLADYKKTFVKDSKVRYIYFFKSIKYNYISYNIHASLLTIHYIKNKAESIKATQARQRERREKMTNSKRFMSEESEGLGLEFKDALKLKGESSTRDERMNGARGLRDAIVVSNDVAIKSIVEEENCLDILLLMINSTDEGEVQEGLKTFGHLFTGQMEIITPILLNKCMPYICKLFLLVNNSPSILESCAWCLANLCADNVYGRNEILKLEGFIQHAVLLLSSQSRPSLISTIIWMLSNLSRGGELNSALFLSTDLFHALIKIIQSPSCNPQIISEFAWLLTYLSLKEGSCVVKIVESNFHMYILQFLSTISTDYSNINHLPMFRFLGNLISSNSKIVLDNIPISLIINVLEMSLSSHTSHPINVKESLWISSLLPSYSPLLGSSTPLHLLFLLLLLLLLLYIYIYTLKYHYT